MKKITKLTKEQEENIPKYIEKWISIAHRPIKKDKAIDVVKNFYKRMGEKEPVIIFGKSPLSCSIMAAMFFISIKKGQLDSQLRSQLDSQLGSQLRSQLGSQLDSQLRSQLDSQLGSQLGSQLDSQLGSQLDSQLGSQLRSQLGSQLDSQLDSQLRSQLDSQLRSQLEKINNDWYLPIWWLGWCGWYNYAKYIGVKFDENIYNLFIDFVSEIHFIIAYKGIVFVSQKPKNIFWKKNQLHNDIGPAIQYEDGYSLWALNGVRLTKEIVETPLNELNPKLILTTKNAEIRREIVRKIGIERVCEKLKTRTIDTKGEMYQLIELEIPEMKTSARYLKMKNPSIDVVHLEGVPPEIDTCQKAINWRAGDINKKWSPSQLT